MVKKGDVVLTLIILKQLALFGFWGRVEKGLCAANLGGPERQKGQALHLETTSCKAALPSRGTWKGGALLKHDSLEGTW